MMMTTMTIVRRRRPSFGTTERGRTRRRRPTHFHNSIAVTLLVTIVALSIISTIIIPIRMVSGQACTSCYRGASMSPTAPQPTCNDMKSRVNGLFQTDTECLDLQLLNYQKLCCSTPPIGYCEYCDDPNIEWNKDMIVPTGQFVDPYTCFDYSAQNDAYIGMFQDGTCEDTFLRRAGHYCGCGSEQVQECWLCPDKQPPTKPEKSDGWVTNSKCRGIEYLFSLFKKNECDSFPYTVGADLAIYCGCNGLNQTEIDEQSELYTCNLCENGGYVTNPDTKYTNKPFPKTCKQAEEFARDIIKTPAGCRNPNYFDEAREVCTCSEQSSAFLSTLLPSMVAIRLLLLISSLTTILIVLSLVL